MCVCVSQVIGVEPELHNFGMAVFNAGHRQNVFLERAAVTTRNGWSKKSSIGDHLDWAYTEQPAEGLETADGFKAITMTHLLDKYKWDFVDILKVRHTHTHTTHTTQTHTDGHRACLYVHACLAYV